MTSAQSMVAERREDEEEGEGLHSRVRGEEGGIRLPSMLGSARAMDGSSNQLRKRRGCAEPREREMPKKGLRGVKAEGGKGGRGAEVAGSGVGGGDGSGGGTACRWILRKDKDQLWCSRWSTTKLTIVDSC